MQDGSFLRFSVSDLARGIAGGAGFVAAVDCKLQSYCAEARGALRGAAGALVVVGLAGLDVDLAAGGAGRGVGIVGGEVRVGVVVEGNRSEK